jgi:hypothetical protein
MTPFASALQQDGSETLAFFTSCEKRCSLRRRSRHPVSAPPSEVPHHPVARPRMPSSSVSNSEDATSIALARAISGRGARRDAEEALRDERSPDGGARRQAAGAEHGCGATSVSDASCRAARPKPYERSHGWRSEEAAQQERSRRRSEERLRGIPSRAEAQR